MFAYIISGIFLLFSAIMFGSWFLRYNNPSISKSVQQVKQNTMGHWHDENKNHHKNSHGCC